MKKLLPILVTCPAFNLMAEKLLLHRSAKPFRYVSHQMLPLAAQRIENPALALLGRLFFCMVTYLQDLPILLSYFCK